MLTHELFIPLSYGVHDCQVVAQLCCFFSTLLNGLHPRMGSYLLKKKTNQHHIIPLMVALFFVLLSVFLVDCMFLSAPLSYLSWNISIYGLYKMCFLHPELIVAV